MLCKSLRFKTIGRKDFGQEINEIKSKNELDLLGQNIWIAPNGRRVFGRFYHMRHGKIMGGFNIR